jgi:hypothetical protein
MSQGVGLTGARWLSSFTCNLDITRQPAITLLIFIITIICAILDLAFFDGYRLVQESASDFWSCPLRIKTHNTLLPLNLL